MLFLFLILALIHLFIQGRFLCCEIVALGMHSSMTDINFCSHRSHAASILDTLVQEYPVSSVNQSVGFGEVSMSIPPDGSFACFHGACISRPFQGNIDSIMVRVTQWRDYIAV